MCMIWYVWYDRYDIICMILWCVRYDMYEMIWCVWYDLYDMICVVWYDMYDMLCVIWYVRYAMIQQLWKTSFASAAILIHAFSSSSSKSRPACSGWWTLKKKKRHGLSRLRFEDTENFFVWTSWPLDQTQKIFSLGFITLLHLPCPFGLSITSCNDSHWVCSYWDTTFFKIIRI